MSTQSIDGKNDGLETESNLEVLTPNEVSLIERAEIDSAIATAKRYPRDLGKVKRDMREMATLDEETASAMNFALPRGGKLIQGPSIRMAEVAVACYGNISVHSRIVETTEKFVRAQGVGHDLEKNVRGGVEVRRRVFPSKKAQDKAAALEDAINLASAAAAAIAFREAAFKVIPRALIKPVADEAKKVGAGDAKTFSARRKEAMAKFKEKGVSAQKIYNFLGRTNTDSITTEDLQVLFGILTAIEEGHTTPDQAFEQTSEAKTFAATSFSEPEPAAETAQEPAEALFP